MNVPVPGATSTPGLQGLVPNAEQDKASTEMVIAQFPLARMGRPEEIAAAALFLASEESSFVNGIEFYIDGGMAQA